jgi:hypothetical protein
LTEKKLVEIVLPDQEEQSRAKVINAVQVYSSDRVIRKVIGLAPL